MIISKEDVEMAQIRMDNFKRIEKNRNMVHDVVYATYTVFEQNGERYLQIDTYGKSDRENPDKISQSIQIDKEMAQGLIEMMKKEFKLM